MALYPEQYGQPEPAERVATVASQLCPKLHFQRLFLFEPAVTVDGSQPSACEARSGCVTLKGSFWVAIATHYGSTMCRKNSSDTFEDFQVAFPDVSRYVQAIPKNR
jgi:hypothetical protein